MLNPLTLHVSFFIFFIRLDNGDPKQKRKLTKAMREWKGDQKVQLNSLYICVLYSSNTYS